MKRIERELKAIHSAQRAFYGKAWVIEHTDEHGHTGRIELRSYDTIVCVVEFGETCRMTIENMQSKTTRRHIREFVIQNFGLVAWDNIARDYERGVVRWFPG